MPATDDDVLDVLRREPARRQLGLMQARLPMPHAEHHVVSMTHEGVLPYYAVLLNEFQEYLVEEIEEYLRR